MLPINAPAINILTTSPSMNEFPSKPSSRAMETIGPFMTLQNTQSSFNFQTVHKMLENQKPNHHVGFKSSSSCASAYHSEEYQIIGFRIICYLSTLITYSCSKKRNIILGFTFTSTTKYTQPAVRNCSQTRSSNSMLANY